MINERGIFMDHFEADRHECDIPLCKAIIALLGNEVKTAIDIGCGNGAYTKELRDGGIECAGYDGSPLTPELSNGLCGIMDFSEEVDLGEFDLALSLEVGEHIPQQYEQVFIDNVCWSSKKYVILSWAVEGQGGMGHVNCRNNDYIIGEMEKRGFVFNEAFTNQLRSEISLYWLKDTLMVFNL